MDELFAFVCSHCGNSVEAPFLPITPTSAHVRSRLQVSITWNSCLHDEATDELTEWFVIIHQQYRSEGSNRTRAGVSAVVASRAKP